MAKPKTILVVDDDEAMRRILASLLEAGGHTAVCAGDGPQAVAYAKEQAPDLILMDLLMPGMGGGEAIKKIRALDGLAEVPVIVVTGSATKEHVLEARRVGADDVMTKALFEAGLFLRRIELVFERCSSRKTAAAR